MVRSLTLVGEKPETAPPLGMCGGLYYQCSPTVLDTGTCAQVMALWGGVGRYGLVGGSMLLEAGSESLKMQCHFKFTLYFMPVIQDVSPQLQSPCPPLKLSEP